MPMVVTDILESSLPKRTYTLCNRSNSSVNIAYNTKSLSRPTISNLDHNNCYSVQTYGSLSFLCAYNPDAIDTDWLGSSTDDMKCATKKGLEHNFQWYVDENLYLNRGLDHDDDNQNNSLESPYTILPKNYDNSSDAIVAYRLRGSVK